MEVKVIKGFKDILPPETKIWRMLEERARKVLEGFDARHGSREEATATARPQESAQAERDLRTRGSTLRAMSGATRAGSAYNGRH